MQIRSLALTLALYSMSNSAMAGDRSMTRTQIRVEIDARIANVLTARSCTEQTTASSELANFVSALPNKALVGRRDIFKIASALPDGDATKSSKNECNTLYVAAALGVFGRRAAAALPMLKRARRHYVYRLAEITPHPGSVRKGRRNAPTDIPPLNRDTAQQIIDSVRETSAVYGKMSFDIVAIDEAICAIEPYSKHGGRRC